MIGKILAHCILIIRWISIDSTTGDNYYLYNGVSVTLKIFFFYGQVPWSCSVLFFFQHKVSHETPSLPKLATNLSIGNIWKYGVQSINRSIIYFNTLRQRAKKSRSKCERVNCYMTWKNYSFSCFSSFK